MTAPRAGIALPAGVAPRLLSREQAAAYVGLSPETFLAEVAAGTFPRPFPLKRTRRRLWDRAEIDRALDARRTVEVEGSGERDWHERERRWHQNRQKTAG